MGRICDFDVRHCLGALLFIGLIPDFATLRDRARSKPFQIIYGLLAMGWPWIRASLASLRDGLLINRRTGEPLVLSVHTIVS